ncbi:unnamed protein product [Ambrosiozyma monospora]|uniref:Unnamed protein product n=1 Tax=Ambrosiozyma monospora TaxID=43982 RepID=A0A9W6YU42_AMBMO|nr:unnamed protein product [Ambrosiozyma monospora]
MFLKNYHFHHDPTNRIHIKNLKLDALLRECAAEDDLTSEYSAYDNDIQAQTSQSQSPMSPPSSSPPLFKLPPAPTAISFTSFENANIIVEPCKIKLSLRAKLKMHHMWHKVNPNHHERREKEEKHPLEWPIRTEFFDQIWTVVRLNEKNGDGDDGSEDLDLANMSQLKELIELMEIHGDEQCERDSERDGDGYEAQEHQESIASSESKNSSMIGNSDGVSSCTTVSATSDTIEAETRYYTSVETQFEELSQLFSQSLFEDHLEQLEQIESEQQQQQQQQQDEEDTESFETDGNIESDEEAIEVKVEGAEEDGIDDETLDVELRETVYRYLKERKLTKAKNSIDQQEENNSNSTSDRMELNSTNAFDDLLVEDEEVIGLLCKQMVSHISTNWTAYRKEQTRHRRWVKKLARHVKELKGVSETDDELEG